MKLYKDSVAYFALGCVLRPLLIVYLQVLTRCLCGRGLTHIEEKKVKDKNIMSAGVVQPMGQLPNDGVSQ